MDKPGPNEDMVGGGAFAEAAGGSVRRKPRLLQSAEAVVLGIGDTLKDMLHAGQVEAQIAQNEAWHRYDDLTKHRRELKEREEADSEK